MADALVISPDTQFTERLRSSGGGSLDQCFGCATCTAVCDLAPENQPFPRKEILWAQMGLKEKVASDPDLWLCHQCGDCSARCPRDVKPGDVLAAMRAWVIGRYSVPSFLGAALANPAALPLLLFVPFLVIGGLAFWAQTSGEPVHWSWRGPVEFGAFIPHGYIEMLFISGNILIFALAAVGLYRFYRNISLNLLVGGRRSIIASLPATLIEIAGHGRFGICRVSGYRRVAHLLVMFGFFGAMATAGLALIAMVAFDYGPPIPFSHPIKWLGNASGAAMLIGLGIIIVQRTFNREIVGVTGYSQWLFIWMIVAVAGTGMSIQFLRIAELPILAYSVYGLHLVTVFFLLLYAPYSQFGHLFYRSLALVVAAGAGRLPRKRPVYPPQYVQAA